MVARDHVAVSIKHILLDSWGMTTAVKQPAAAIESALTDTMHPHDTKDVVQRGKGQGRVLSVAELDSFVISAAPLPSSAQNVLVEPHPTQAAALPPPSAFAAAGLPILMTGDPRARDQVRIML